MGYTCWTRHVFFLWPILSSNDYLPAYKIPIKFTKPSLENLSSIKKTANFLAVILPETSTRWHPLQNSIVFIVGLRGQRGYIIQCGGCIHLLRVLVLRARSLNNSVPRLCVGLWQPFQKNQKLTEFQRWTICFYLMAERKKQLAHYLIIERENILLHPKTLPLLENRFHVRICKDRRRPVTRPQNSIVKC